MIENVDLKRFTDPFRTTRDQLCVQLFYRAAKRIVFATPDTDSAVAHLAQIGALLCKRII